MHIEQAYVNQALFKRMNINVRIKARETSEPMIETRYTIIAVIISIIAVQVIVTASTTASTAASTAVHIPVYSVH